MSQPNRRDLEPLQTNNTATLLVGTALWAVALVVLLIVQPAPADRWWIWTCVVGVGGGFFGLWYVRRLDRRTAKNAPPGTARPAEPAPPGTTAGPLEPAPHGDAAPRDGHALRDRAADEVTAKDPRA